MYVYVVTYDETKVGVASAGSGARILERNINNSLRVIIQFPIVLVFIPYHTSITYFLVLPLGIAYS